MSLFTKVGGSKRSRDITALAVLAGLTVAALFFVMGRSRSGTLHILNGLDVPVVVAVNGRTVAIGAHSQSLVMLPNGAYLARTTTQGGKLVERAVVIADSRRDAVVYNVIGAAPLLDVRLRYTAAARSDDNARDVTFHGGRRLAVIDDLDYVFTEPPKSISGEKSRGDIVKHALMAPPGGATMTTSYLLFSGDRAADAVELQRRLVRLDATPIRTLNFMSEAAWMAYGGEEAVVPLLAPSVRLAPPSDDDVAARYLLSSGCRYACDDVRRLVGGFPGADTLPRKLSLLRGLGEADMRRAVAEMAAQHPDHLDVIRSRAWLALIDGKWAECSDLYLRAMKGPYGDFDVEELAWCLQAQGKHHDALAQAARVADSGGEAAWLGAITYAQLAAAGKEPPGTYIDKLEQDQAQRAATKGVWLGVFDRKVEMPREGALADALGIAAAAIESAESGIGHAKTKPAAVRGLPGVLGLMLGGELARRGDLYGAERVLDANRGLRLPTNAIIDYVLRGTVHPLLFRLDPESRAGLDFIRARRLEQLGQDSHLLYDSVRKHDLLSVWVHRLMDAWAAPERKNEVLVYTRGE